MKICALRPGADQSSKAAFAKTCFLLLKIRLAHTNRAKSKNAFEHIFSRKHFARCTCQNVFESAFAFCSIGVAPVISLTKEAMFEHVLAKALLSKAALLDWSAPGLSGDLTKMHSRFKKLSLFDVKTFIRSS